jgi:Methyltransferase FkbM domain
MRYSQIPQLHFLTHRHSGHVCAPCTAVNQYNKGDNRAYPSFGAQPLPIKMTTLDTLLKEGTNVNLIKMDIQGYEVHAMRGMKRVLRESPNLKLLVECSPKLLRKAGSSVQEFFTILEENRFSWMLFDNEKGKLLPISKTEYIARFPDNKDDYGNLLCWKGERPHLQN